MKRHLAFLLSLLLGAGSALAQSGQTINQLSPGAALAGTEQIPMYQAANPAVTTTPSAVAAYAVGSPRSGLNGWVNIKDPRFGATGNGSIDDTAAIQAAIDYAFANDLSAVYCPAGKYVTSDSIWLDPPNNMRATTFTGTGYISGTILTISSGSTSGLSASGGSHIYGRGVAPDTVILSGAGPTYTVNNSQTVGSSGSPIALTGNNPGNPTTPTPISFSFFGDPSNNQTGPNCGIYPNFVNGHAIEVGTGGGMMVANIALQGLQPSGPTSYRGALPSNGVGIAINGGNAGASVTLIRDVTISNYYILINTDTNNVGSLSDTNTFERISGGNSYIAINIQGQNTLINHAIDVHTIGNTIGYNTVFGNPMTVDGGSIQSESGLDNVYTLSSVSSITNTGTDGPFTFTATLVSLSCSPGLPTSPSCTQTPSFDPTGFGFVGIPQVYSWWGFSTPDFGVVPMTLATTCLSGTNTGGGTFPCWNPSTKAATFQLYPPWVFAEFGNYDLSTATHLSAEVQAATVIYADERVYTAQGGGITMNGVTTENEGACTTVLDNNNKSSANVPSRIKDLLHLGSSYAFSGAGNLADKYCNRTMPVIEQETPSPFSAIIVDGGDWASSGAVGWATIESWGSPSGIEVRHANNLNVMFRNGNAGGYGWGQITSVTNAWESEARGLGVLDEDYSLPNLGTSAKAPYASTFETTSPFCGVEPCPWVMPNFSATLLAATDCPDGNIASCTPFPDSFANILPVSCRTVFKSVDWNTGGVPPGTAPAHLYLRSNSCPGFTWGQNITDVTVSAYLIVTGQQAASFTGSISGTTLTVSSGTGIAIGQYLSDGSAGHVTAGTYITGGSGTSWTINNSQTVSGEAMYTSPPVTWRHIGQSPVLYLDATTLSLMFPGLGIYLDSGDGSGSVPFIVTGVYQDLGYVTVMRASSAGGDLMPGTATTVYSCTSACTIGQAAFAFTAY